MKTTHAMCARISALLFILFFSTTIYAGSAKVEVCHVPTGDPDNFHTIMINENALGAHLGHGDLAGACSSACASLCDDGNACTVDDFGDCETNGCPASTIPVDCSDGNLCTDDICDPSSGCANPVAVTCEAPDLCTASTCDPIFGQCEETPMSCDEGESCNSDTGLCEPEVVCPCFTAEELAAEGTTFVCEDNYLGADVTLVMFDNGSIACSGDSCSGEPDPSCGLIVGGSVISLLGPIFEDESTACRNLIAATCTNNGSARSSSNGAILMPGLPIIQ